MSGDKSRSECGQLALMDALVFFSVAVLVSGAMLAYTGSPSREVLPPSGDSPVPVDEMLEAILKASIALAAEAGDGLEITGREPVSECLSAELYALATGVNGLEFAGMNDAVAGIMGSVCGQVFRPHLVAVHPNGSSGEPFLAIPGPCGPCRLAYACSSELPCEDGLLYTVTLILIPAAPSELV